MADEVQVFSCARCNRGGFRSLPGPDGKAYCPWCGDRVSASTAPPPVLDPAPLPTAPAPGLDRVAELEAELRREAEKKQEIKRAVMAEMAQLASQLAEAKALAQRKDEELKAAAAESGRLKEDLAKERKRADDLTGERGNVEAREKAARTLEADLAASRKTSKEMQEARDAAGRDVLLARSELAKAKDAAAAEVAELRKKLSTAEARVQALKNSGEEVKILKESRLRSEKERTELTEKAKTLQGEVEKRDQRVRDLQLLVKTLGERLNDLTSRHFGS